MPLIICGNKINAPAALLKRRYDNGAKTVRCLFFGFVVNIQGTPFLACSDLRLLRDAGDAAGAI